MHRSPRPWLAASLLSLLACGGGGDPDADGAGGSASSYGGSTQATAGAAGAAGEKDVIPHCTDEKLCAPDFHTPPGEGVPPGPPTSGGPAEGGKSVQVVSALFLGGARRDGTPDKEAWKQLGFDLDGWSSTPEQGRHCKAQKAGMTRTIRTDGPHGVDNAFGQLVTGGFSSLLPGALDQDIRQQIAAGQPTLLLAVDALGAASGYPALTGHVSMAQGPSSGAPPDDWSSSSWRPWATPAPLLFSQAYLTGNTLVAWLDEPLALTVSIASLPMRLRIHHARLSVDLSDRAHGVSGQLGGILDPEEFIATLRVDSNAHSAFPCEGTSAYEGIAATIRSYADILLDGTQDYLETCDGISIGLGFETRAALEGESVAAPAIVDPCAAP